MPGAPPGPDSSPTGTHRPAPHARLGPDAGELGGRPQASPALRLAVSVEESCWGRSDPQAEHDGSSGPIQRSRRKIWRRFGKTPASGRAYQAYHSLKGVVKRQTPHPRVWLALEIAAPGRKEGSLDENTGVVSTTGNRESGEPPSGILPQHGYRKSAHMEHKAFTTRSMCLNAFCEHGQAGTMG